MNQKHQIYKLHSQASHKFLAGRFPLIVANPHLFTLDCLAPEGLLLSSDSASVREALKNKICFFDAIDADQRLSSFLQRIFQADGDICFKTKNSIRASPSMLIHSPSAGESSGNPDVREERKQKKVELDYENVACFKIKNNPYKILVGGGFLTNLPEPTETEEDKNDSFQKLLVTGSTLKEKEESFRDHVREENLQICEDLGNVFDRKFVVTFLGTKQVIKSGPLHTEEVVKLFSSLGNKSCFLITNIRNKRVYQYYYFVSHVLPLMKKKIKDEKTKKLQKKSGKKLRQELAVSPGKISGSRHSGEQALKQNPFVFNKNLSSISNVSNGSNNINSFFHSKNEGLSKKATSSTKKIRSNESFGIRNDSTKKSHFTQSSTRSKIGKRGILFDQLSVKAPQMQGKSKPSQTSKKGKSIKARLEQKQNRLNSEKKSLKLIQEFHPTRSNPTTRFQRPFAPSGLQCLHSNQPNQDLSIHFQGRHLRCNYQQSKDT